MAGIRCGVMKMGLVCGVHGMWRWLVLPILLLAFLARTQAAVPVINGPAEVSAFLYAASATRAANEKVADSRIRADAMRIASLEKAVKAGGAKVAELIAAQDAYVDRLAQRDHAYAAEIAVLRDAAMQLIASPERAAALRAVLAVARPSRLRPVAGVHAGLRVLGRQGPAGAASGVCAGCRTG